MIDCKKIDCIFESTMQPVSELACDECGKHICWVYDFDLNGSYFYCDDCVDKNKAPEAEEASK